jgi:hypothetical protein
MADLVAFLNARLNDDEAEAASHAGPPSLRARQRREVEAKRKIIGEVVPAIFDLDYKLIEETALDRDVEAHLPLLHILAAIYRDHPDYDPSWTLDSTHE